MINRNVFPAVLTVALAASVGCSSKSPSLPKATGYGTAIVESSGSKQVGSAEIGRASCRERV